MRENVNADPIDLASDASLDTENVPAVGADPNSMLQYQAPCFGVTLGCSTDWQRQGRNPW